MEIINNPSCHKHDQHNQLWLHHGHKIAKLTVDIKLSRFVFDLCCVCCAHSLIMETSFRPRRSVRSSEPGIVHIFFCFDLITDRSFTQDFILKILKIFYN